MASCQTFFCVCPFQGLKEICQGPGQCDQNPPPKCRATAAGLLDNPWHMLGVSFLCLHLSLPDLFSLKSAQTDVDLLLVVDSVVIRSSTGGTTSRMVKISGTPASSRAACKLEPSVLEARRRLATEADFAHRAILSAGWSSYMHHQWMRHAHLSLSGSDLPEGANSQRHSSSLQRADSNIRHPKCLQINSSHKKVFASVSFLGILVVPSDATVIRSSMSRG